MATPIIIFNPNMERETGRKAQMGNINAAKAVADVIRTCLGPRAMLKMLLDPMGGIVLTNDGNAILREIDVTHPAAKSMIELSRTQDEEVGDGTTSVIILSGELLVVSEPFLEQKIHPTVIIEAYSRALEDANKAMERFSFPIKIEQKEEVMKILRSCLGTKLLDRWGDFMCELAFQAVKMVTVNENGRTEIDIKRYVRIEKIPGGDIEDSRLLSGIMLNKDIVHPNMRRRIENPKILLLDCSLEYKKGESQTNIEISKEEHFSRYLQLEEEYIENICRIIISMKPDIVITEKGVSDLAAHYLMRSNITAIRRVRKTDNNRIARAVGASIVNQVEEIKESDLGTKCGLFYVDKIGDE
jgi:T-complex protein 1 subunit gamma